MVTEVALKGSRYSNGVPLFVMFVTIGSLASMEAHLGYSSLRNEKPARRFRRETGDSTFSYLLSVGRRSNPICAVPSVEVEQRGVRQVSPLSLPCWR